MLQGWGLFAEEVVWGFLWQKQGKHSRAFVFVVAEVMKASPPLCHVGHLLREETSQVSRGAWGSPACPSSCPPSVPAGKGKAPDVPVGKSTCLFSVGMLCDPRMDRAGASGMFPVPVWGSGRAGLAGPSSTIPGLEGLWDSCLPLPIFQGLGGIFCNFASLPLCLGSVRVCRSSPEPPSPLPFVLLVPALLSLCVISVCYHLSSVKQEPLGPIPPRLLIVPYLCVCSVGDIVFIYLF